MYNPTITGCYSSHPQALGVPINPKPPTTGFLSTIVSQHGNLEGVKSYCRPQVGQTQVERRLSPKQVGCVFLVHPSLGLFKAEAKRKHQHMLSQSISSMLVDGSLDGGAYCGEPGFSMVDANFLSQLASKQKRGSWV